MNQEDKQLHALISSTSDELISERFTENKIQQRVEQWQQGGDTPTLAEQTVFMLNENRDYTEELLFRVVKKLRD
ncbi:hypothetical protein [Lacticaseibacillus zhaodongensis]|uniref:hypothetical protein n=1 Tax=Lacticaseibacillus zhaodongensis TaxID=2668065 RepID=UPI0012D34707|nr:hypothetical protein [Lacticaseibacillus zhaodongensis]